MAARAPDRAAQARDGAVVQRPAPPVATADPQLALQTADAHARGVPPAGRAQPALQPLDPAQGRDVALTDDSGHAGWPTAQRAEQAPRSRDLSARLRLARAVGGRIGPVRGALDVSGRGRRNQDRGSGNNDDRQEAADPGPGCAQRSHGAARHYPSRAQGEPGPFRRWPNRVRSVGRSCVSASRYSTLSRAALMPPTVCGPRRVRRIRPRRSRMNVVGIPVRP